MSTAKQLTKCAKRWDLGFNPFPVSDESVDMALLTGQMSRPKLGWMKRVDLGIRILLSEQVPND